MLKLFGFASLYRGKKRRNFSFLLWENRYFCNRCRHESRFFYYRIYEHICGTFIKTRYGECISSRFSL